MDYNRMNTESKKTRVGINFSAQSRNIDKWIITA